MAGCNIDDAEPLKRLERPRNHLPHGPDLAGHLRLCQWRCWLTLLDGLSAIKQQAGNSTLYAVQGQHIYQPHKLALFAGQLAHHHQAQPRLALEQSAKGRTRTTQQIDPGQGLQAGRAWPTIHNRDDVDVIARAGDMQNLFATLWRGTKHLDPPAQDDIQGIHRIAFDLKELPSLETTEAGGFGHALHPLRGKLECFCHRLHQADELGHSGGQRKTWHQDG